MRKTEKKRRYWTGTVIMWAGVLLVLIGVGLIAYNMYDESRATLSSEKSGNQVFDLIEKNKQERDAALEEWKKNIPDHTEYVPDYILDPTMEMPTVTLENGYSYVGMISLPTIERELAVIGDWSYPALKVTACRYSGSAYTDDMILCGHNYRSHFGYIKNLAIGDPVIFTDMNGNVFRYSVAEIDTLEPRTLKELGSDGWALTLFTCNLSGKMRVTVHCVREK